MGELVNWALAQPRGIAHPWANVAYLPEGSTHDHILVLGGDTDRELIAEDLATLVRECNEDKHIDRHGNPHGQTHPDADEAYRSAIRQMEERDYWQECLDHCLKVEHFALWGNKHPADIVFQPKPGSPREWQVVIKHPFTGMPHFYDIGKDFLPPPEKNYVEGKYGYYKKGRASRERGRR